MSVTRLASIRRSPPSLVPIGELSVDYHHRLHRAVEDPHRVDESNVVTGDDGEGASDVRVTLDDAPHDDRVMSGKCSDGARRKLKPIDEAQVGRPIFGPDVRPDRPAPTVKKVSCHTYIA